MFPIFSKADVAFTSTILSLRVPSAERTNPPANTSYHLRELMPQPGRLGSTAGYHPLFRQPGVNTSTGPLISGVRASNRIPLIGCFHGAFGERRQFLRTGTAPHLLMHFMYALWCLTRRAAVGEYGWLTMVIGARLYPGADPGTDVVCGECRQFLRTGTAPHF